MAKCEDCGREMQTATSCNKPYFKVTEGETARQKKDIDKLVRRVMGSSVSAGQSRCHDCAIVMKAGNVHHYGCDWERCPIDKGQAISCGHGFLAVTKSGRPSPTAREVAPQLRPAPPRSNVFDIGFRGVTG